MSRLNYVYAHARIQEFPSGGGGGGGGSGQSDKKAQLILQKSNAQFQRNLSFFKVPEGVQHFPGGTTFSRGGGGGRGSNCNCLFPIDTHTTCDFPGGTDPLPPPPPPSGSALDAHPQGAVSD